MIKSMTAFGKGQIENESGRVVVELQSINRKYLDISLNLPKELSSLDPEVREWLRPHISRGQIQLRINYFNKSLLPYAVTLNIPLVEQYKSSCEQLAEYLGVKSFDPTAFIMQQPQVFNTEQLVDDSKTKGLVFEALKKALEQFQTMKIEEGQSLEKDLRARLKRIEEFLALILPIVKETPSKYQEKLLKRLQELEESSEIIDPRVLVEVAIFADKMDVSEEITRFHSHISQFYKFLEAKEAVGKTLDFLLQEMFREANTMSSKIGDLKGLQYCLEIKGELEKIREQIQNIE